jgi:hypothetical protein
MAKPKKKAATKTSTGRVNKSAWIRSQPASLSAKDVVDKAKSEGIALSLAQVYTARSTAKRQQPESKRAAAASAPDARQLPKLGRPPAVSGDLRREFMVLAVRIGSDEAQRLLDRIVDVQGN